jgi:hypothetical protein
VNTTKEHMGIWMGSDGSVLYLYCGGSCIHLSKFTVLCTKRANFTICNKSVGET